MRRNTIQWLIVVGALSLCAGGVLLFVLSRSVHHEPSFQDRLKGPRPSETGGDGVGQFQKDQRAEGSAVSRVVVFDGRSHMPIEGANVMVRTGRHGLPAASITDSKGVALVRGRGSAHIEVSAYGYVAYRSQVGLEAGETVQVPLAQAGKVVLTFRDENGRPIEGVAVALLPPLERGTWVNPGWKRLFARVGHGRVLQDNFKKISIAHDYLGPDAPRIAWRGISNVAGRIEWGTLVPRAGYRLGLLSDRVPIASMDPRFDGDADEDLQDELSGRISVSAGTTREFHVTVHMATEVRGRVGGPGGPSGTHVRVQLCSKLLHSGIREDAVLNITVKEDREFRFRAIRPGAKILRLTWVTDGADTPVAAVFFRSVEAKVGPGETRNVGLISPPFAEAGRHEIRVRVHGPTDARSGAKFDARLITRSIDNVGRYNYSSNIVGSMRLETGRIIRLVGLPRGVASLVAEFGESGLQASDGWPSTDTWSVSVPSRRLQEFYLSSTQPVLVVDLSVLKGAGVRLWAVHLFNTATGNAFSRIIDLRRESSSRQRVPVGSYRMIVAPAQKEAVHWKDAKKGLWWAGRAEIHKETLVSVRSPQVTRSVKGTAVGSEGQYLSFGFAGWPRGFRALSVKVGAEGEFTIRGLPHCSLIETRTATVINVGDTDVKGVCITR